MKVDYMTMHEVKRLGMKSSPGCIYLQRWHDEAMLLPERIDLQAFFSLADSRAVRLVTYIYAS